MFLSVRDSNKTELIPVAKLLVNLGFKLIATGGTHKALIAAGVESTPISKLSEGRPNIMDFVKNGQVQLLINTPTRKGPTTDEGKLRSLAVLNKVPIVTTMSGASAARTGD